MINWTQLVPNSLWLAGVAALLAVVSYSDYERRHRRDGLPLVPLMRAVAGSFWAYVGLLLFCAGMSLTSSTLPERGLWALVATGVIYIWWNAHNARRADAVLDGCGPVRMSTSQHLRLRGQKIQVGAEWIVRTELLWLALLAPFFLYPAPERVPVLFGLPAIWIARYIAHGRFLPSTPADWAIVVMAAMLLVSLFATFDIRVSLSKITLLLLGIGLYYAVVEWVAARARLMWAASGYALAGAALAAVGLLGTDWTNKLPALSQLAARLPGVLQRLSSNEGGFNPNVVGGALLWIVPLQLALLIWWWRAPAPTAPRRWALRLTLLFASALTSGTLLLTQSRNALVSVALGIILFLGLMLPRLGRLILFAMLAIGLTAGAIVGPQSISSRLIDPFGSEFSTGGSRTALERGQVWSRAIDAIGDFPFTGIGMGTFHTVQPALYPIAAFAPVKGIDHAHNQFLQAGLDLGLPGLAAYMALWLVAIALVVQLWRASPERSIRLLPASIAAGLLASLVFGMADAVVMVAKPGVFFWALLGLLTGAWKQITQHKVTYAGTYDTTRQKAEESISAVTIA